MTTYIHTFAEGNPKRPGTKAHARWPKLHAKPVMTLDAYYEAAAKAGVPRAVATADIQWEAARGLVWKCDTDDAKAARKAMDEARKA